MFKLWYAVVAILAGATCYFIAKKRGMPNPGLWFIGGVFGSIAAVGLTMLIANFYKSKKKGGFS